MCVRMVAWLPQRLKSTFKKKFFTFFRILANCVYYKNIRRRQSEIEKLFNSVLQTEICSSSCERLKAEVMFFTWFATLK